MHRPILILLFVVAISTPGCGHTPYTIFRQAITLRNEMADTMMKVTDEESAERIYKTKFEPLKKRWEDFTHIAEKEFKEYDDKQKEGIGKAFELFLEEAKKTEERMIAQEERIKSLRQRLYQQMLQEQNITQPPFPSIDSEFPKLTQWLNVKGSFDVGKVWSDNPLTKKNNGQGGGGPPGGFPGGGPGGP